MACLSAAWLHLGFNANIRRCIPLTAASSGLNLNDKRHPKVNMISVNGPMPPSYADCGASGFMNGMSAPSKIKQVYGRTVDETWEVRMHPDRVDLATNPPPSSRLRCLLSTLPLSSCRCRNWKTSRASSSPSRAFAKSSNARSAMMNDTARGQWQSKRPPRTCRPLQRTVAVRGQTLGNAWITSPSG
jgi:hypothetical protein